MTDQEIVDGLINRDEKITDWFFNIKYRPLFINVIKLIFDYQVDYDECISELYYHLMKNDAAVLRNFEGRSTIGTWIKIVAIRFFREQKKREQMIEDESKEPLYEQNHEEEIDDSESKIAAKIDLERLFDLMSNKRYVMVIRELVLKEVEPEYFYGALTPSTGYTPQFDLHSYYNGFFIALPLRTDPTRLHQSVHQEKMFDVFHQYQSWVEIMGVPTVGQLNSKVLAGDASELIKIAEAFHENKLAQVAGCVAEANRERGVRLVLISGPSSSGKTTFAKRLGVQLRVLGLNPVLISLDDYFVDREKTPRDENGEYDYEALEAIDLEQFNDHLKRLERGESVDIPRYDFISGTRQWHDNPLQLDERSVLIVEGIHGLNPALTPGVPESRKFKIYVSCFTSVALDNVSRIATSDNRLLRRLTRDYRTRGNDALSTLARWESVRRGEEKHIFPYQENADVMFNSSLFYEISVLRRFAEPILREVPDTVPEYGEAKRMLKFLDNFIPISPEEIPPTSLLREFIGGSSFKY